LIRWIRSRRVSLSAGPVAIAGGQRARQPRPAASLSAGAVLRPCLLGARSVVFALLGRSACSCAQAQPSHPRRSDGSHRTSSRRHQLPRSIPWSEGSPGSPGCRARSVLPLPPTRVGSGPRTEDGTSPAREPRSRRRTYTVRTGRAGACHRKQDSTTCRYVIWRNRHADDQRVRAASDRARAACCDTGPPLIGPNQPRGDYGVITTRHRCVQAGWYT
jgi:hypothetical protein